MVIINCSFAQHNSVVSCHSASTFIKKINTCHACSLSLAHQAQAAPVEAHQGK